MDLPIEDNKKVMVVDDSDDLRGMVCGQLKLLGYDVVEARDGREAVALAMKTRPALIIMDMQMPIMDGLSATTLLRDMKELSSTTIIAFSASDSDRNRQAALDAGCSDYVNKFSGLKPLVTLVRNFLPSPSAA